MDIEIYLHKTTMQRIVAWLESRIGPLVPIARGEDGVWIYHWSDPAPLTAITITPGAGGSFTAVWLNSSRSPWSSHVDCARDAHRALGAEVRCDPSGLCPAAGPSTFWRVTDSGEEPFEWVD